MKKENDNLEKMFQNFENKWDIQELNENHKTDFLKKLNFKTKKKNYTKSLAIAAAIITLFGIFIFFNPIEKQNVNGLKFASKETKQTDSIFNVLIKNQLELVKEKKSPKNKKIISDALKQMKALDDDYDKIIQELQKNGENKQIIYAMISNLQTRISFLQNVLKQLEENEKFENTTNENTI